MRPHAFELGGQRGWFHDEGHPAGVFHTFDRLDVGRGFGPRKVHVLVPRSHGSTDRRYPVMYLHDGDTTFWPGGVAGGNWDVAGTLSRLGREIIVVAVHPVERDREYTHVDWAEGRRPWGRLPEHADYFADDVAGWVNAAYRTDPDPRRTAVVGSSHGGLAAFWTATRRPEVFGLAGCFSPSFFSGLDRLALPLRVQGSLERSELVAGARDVLRDPARRPRIWLCWGGERAGGEHNEVVEALAERRAVEMAGLLRSWGYTHHGSRGAGDPSDAELITVGVPHHGHDEGAWRERFGWMVESFYPERA